MDDNEMIGADAEADSVIEGVEPAAETTEIVIDTSAFALEVAVLEEKLDTLTDKVTGCYCMLLILAVLGLRNVLRSIIRKVRGGMEDV